MAALTDHAEAHLIDALLGLDTFAAPGTYHMALSTADPLDDLSGLAEPSTGGYARIAIVNDGTTFARAAKVISNTVAAIEAAADATASQGTLSHWALMDASSGGNGWVHGAFTSAQELVSGKRFRMPVGDLDITFASATNGLTDYAMHHALDALFGLAAWASPATWYMALSTTTIGVDGSGLTEPGFSYARKAIATGAAEWTRTANAGSNDNEHETVKASGGSWGTITDKALADAAGTGAGNLWVRDALTDARTIDDGDSYIADPGDILVRVA